ncbi:MAG TPA: hypothetical protein VE173_07455, partial [Longimicrobiales bacterium]|nr:hypothetical protein [Longimicrobiales bacterium]
LGNLKEIIEEADPEALVLIDEMGTGTDPSEGAALARAILETLVERGTLTVVTSHLGVLKTLDTEGSGIVNGSLQFDPDRMEPTYRFVKGRPGRSYGLAIAGRLELPRSVLDRAESHVSSGEASVDELLERLERKDREARELVASLAREREEASRLRDALERREVELRQRERSAERRARDDARDLLMKAREEVEEAIREVRGARDEEALEESSRRARRRVEEAARRQERRRPAPGGPEGPPPELRVGQTVRVRGSGARGRVVELREERVVVETSGLRLEVPAAGVHPVPDGGGGRNGEDPRPAGHASAGGSWSRPEAEAASEVDLRGLRVDEVELELGRA